MGFEAKSAGLPNSTAFHSLAPGQTRVAAEALAPWDHRVTERAWELWLPGGEARGPPRRGHLKGGADGSGGLLVGRAWLRAGNGKKC